jgi:hypothetical protein
MMPMDACVAARCRQCGVTMCRSRMIAASSVATTMCHAHRDRISIAIGEAAPMDEQAN